MAVESPTHISIGRSIGGVSKLFNSDAGSYPVKFRQTYSDVPQSISSPSNGIRKDLSRERCGMSSTFEEVLRGYDNEHDTTDGVEAESRMDRIMDAFRRGESMLLSTDNIRPKSRCKTSLHEKDFQRTMNGVRLERPQSLTNSSKSKTFAHSSPDEINHKRQDHSDSLNVSNNAESQENIVTKKGKKYRKRAKSEGKSKKHKYGKPPPQPTSKYFSAPAIFTQPNSHISRRISSEPTTSKTPPACSIGSQAMQGTAHDQRNKLQVLSINNVKPTKDGAPAPLSIKCKNSHNNITSVTRYTHGNRPLSSPALDHNSDNGLLFAQGVPVIVHKSEVRVKSGHSTQSEEACNKSPTNIKDENFKDNLTINNEQLLVLNAKPCNVYRTEHVVSPSGSQRKHLHPVLSADMASRQASLEAIYGAMHKTANRITAQVEELKKVKKVFLSDRQSGNIKESGMEYPCAPPATPNPDVLKRYEYVPSMADIRSQRAVKGRLQAMEKDAQKKKEKQKETAAKLEKQQIKDREKILKAKQRKEIYALNKVMTELEHKRFLDFCQSKGLNKT